MAFFFKMFVAVHVALFRMTGGKMFSSMGGMSVLLLTTKGRKTGKVRTVPVAYMLDAAGNPLVCASKAGMPDNPAWFNNLAANPDVSYEIGAEAKKARAEVAAQPLRDELWKTFSSKYTNFQAYEKKTTRVIPMVTLKPAA